MKKCKCCFKTISLLGGDYCDECYKRLPLNKKFVEGLKREHFFKQGSTNRSLRNFSEYGFKDKNKEYCFYPNSATPNFFKSLIKSNLAFCLPTL